METTTPSSSSTTAVCSCDSSSSSMSWRCNDGSSDSSRCSPHQSPSPSKLRSQSPSSRLLMGECWQTGSNGRLCRSNPMIRRSLSPLDTSSTGPCLRVSKDPVQPATGSLSDIRRRIEVTSTAEEEDENFDDFPEGSGSRPRAFTCPVSRAFNRKLRSKMLNRPPTPTYRELSPGSSFDFQFLERNEKMTEGCERRLSSGPSELEAIIETL